MKMKKSLDPSWNQPFLIFLLIVSCLTCISNAAPLHESTDLEQYPGTCYYNYNHYNEGDKILTNEPCLNCTCHNQMLMCYLRVCPFTKPIGHDCIVEKREDQCCPIITCPNVPVELIDHKTTDSKNELGFSEKFGCYIDSKFYPEGAQVPSNPHKPCELCYCIKNRTSCLMQECTLHVDGCQPIYNRGVCCPVRYDCEHDSIGGPYLEDSHTTVRPTEGFILTTVPSIKDTTTCLYNDQKFADGALIPDTKPCEHCYCMKGDIVCAVQDCAIHLDSAGQNCTFLPPAENECCPSTYICQGEEQTEISILDENHDLQSQVDIMSAATTTLPDESDSDSDSGLQQNLHETVSEEDVQLQEHIDDIPKTSTTKTIEVETNLDATTTGAPVANIKYAHENELGGLETTTQLAELESHPEDETIHQTDKPIELEASQDTTTEFDHKTKDKGDNLATEIVEGNVQEQEVTTDSAESVNIVPNEIIPIAIPGEGDCLYDNITYKNNSDVPKITACDVHCTCLSSIIKCKKMECAVALGPNCRIIESELTDSCCPTYKCDGEKEEILRPEEEIPAPGKIEETLGTTISSLNIDDETYSTISSHISNKKDDASQQAGELPELIPTESPSLGSGVEQSEDHAEHHEEEHGHQGGDHVHNGGDHTQLEGDHSQHGGDHGQLEGDHNQQVEEGSGHKIEDEPETNIEDHTEAVLIADHMQDLNTEDHKLEVGGQVPIDEHTEIPTEDHVMKEDHKKGEGLTEDHKQDEEDHTEVAGVEMLGEDHKTELPIEDHTEKVQKTEEASEDGSDLTDDGSAAGTTEAAATLDKEHTDEEKPAVSIEIESDKMEPQIEVTTEAIAQIENEDKKHNLEGEDTDVKPEISDTTDSIVHGGEDGDLQQHLEGDLQHNVEKEEDKVETDLDHHVVEMVEPQAVDTTEKVIELETDDVSDKDKKPEQIDSDHDHVDLETLPESTDSPTRLESESHVTASAPVKHIDGDDLKDDSVHEENIAPIATEEKEQEAVKPTVIIEDNTSMVTEQTLGVEHTADSEDTNLSTESSLVKDDRVETESESVDDTKLEGHSDDSSDSTTVQPGKELTTDELMSAVLDILKATETVPIDGQIVENEQGMNVGDKVEENVEESIGGGKPVEGHVEEPIDEQKPVDGHVEEPIEEQKPIEGHVGEPIEEQKPVDGHVEEPMEEQKPVDGHVEEPMEEQKPIDGHVEESIEEQKPIDSHVEEPMEEQKPVESHAGESIEEQKPVESHVGESMEEQKPVESHVEEPIHPVEGHIKEPMEEQTPVDELVEKPVDGHIANHVEEPVEGHVDEATDNNIQKPVDEPVGGHVENPADVEKPLNGDVQKPLDGEVEQSGDGNVEEPAHVDIQKPVDSHLEEPIEESLNGQVLEPVDVHIDEQTNDMTETNLVIVDSIDYTTETAVNKDKIDHSVSEGEKIDHPETEDDLTQQHIIEGQHLVPEDIPIQTPSENKDHLFNMIIDNLEEKTTAQPEVAGGQQVLTEEDQSFSAEAVPDVQLPVNPTITTSSDDLPSQAVTQLTDVADRVSTEVESTVPTKHTELTGMIEHEIKDEDSTSSTESIQTEHKDHQIPLIHETHGPYPTESIQGEVRPEIVESELYTTASTFVEGDKQETVTEAEDLPHENIESGIKTPESQDHEVSVDKEHEIPDVSIKTPEHEEDGVPQIIDSGLNTTKQPVHEVDEDAVTESVITEDSVNIPEEHAPEDDSVSSQTEVSVGLGEKEEELPESATVSAEDTIKLELPESATDSAEDTIKQKLPESNSDTSAVDETIKEELPESNTASSATEETLKEQAPTVPAIVDETNKDQLTELNTATSAGEDHIKEEILETSTSKITEESLKPQISDGSVNEVVDSSAESDAASADSTTPLPVAEVIPTETAMLEPEQPEIQAPVEEPKPHLEQEGLDHTTKLPTESVPSSTIKTEIEEHQTESSPSAEEVTHKEKIPSIPIEDVLQSTTELSESLNKTEEDRVSEMPTSGHHVEISTTQTPVHATPATHHHHQQEHHQGHHPISEEPIDPEEDLSLHSTVGHPTSSSFGPSGFDGHTESGLGPLPGHYGTGDEEDYTEEEDPGAFGPGTCRYGGKLFVSAQQIPRDDPCDFCFCFRSDIICLQQSCPPPISGCHEEPIQGFCCPRYECPVSMGGVLNLTTTTTTTTTLPPHFMHRPSELVKRTGCYIGGQTFKVGEAIQSASGPCIQCSCGGDGQMKCEPKVCTPEPMLRQMIAVVASRRR